MNTLSSILLQSQQSGLSSMLMIVAMIAIFYFVMIRPQSTKDTTIIVEVAPNVDLKLDKASVYPVVEEPVKNKK